MSNRVVIKSPSAKVIVKGIQQAVVTPVVPTENTRITEAADRRITEDGNVRITE